MWKALRLARGFFLWSGVADILQAAKSYAKLLDIEYQIVLGKKNKNITLSIVFDEVHFFHLAGLQYLKDLSAVLSESREQIFRRILRGSLQKQMLESSKFYSEITDRIEYLSYLEQIMDSNDTVFKYNSRLNVFSAVQADFLMKNEVLTRNVFVFSRWTNQLENISVALFFRSLTKIIPRDRPDGHYFIKRRFGNLPARRTCFTTG